ncbi:hypothetical protein KA005_15260 [bacterium]|nr:hypothetical protein [bacterium]
MKKMLMISLSVVAVVMFGYSMQASACHIENASITANCVKDSGQYYIDYYITASTVPAGATVNYELTITGPSSAIESGTFTADIGPFHGSVSVTECGTYLITGYVEYHGTYNLIPVTVECSCDTPGPGTGTPGYWKTHPDAWPVEAISIGGVSYTKDEAIGNMWMPEKGDKTFTMFRALVAAKLNVLVSNDASCIEDTIADADAWMAGYPVGSGVKGNSDAWQEGEPLYFDLDDYNNGLLCALSRDDLE